MNVNDALPGFGEVLDLLLEAAASNERVLDYPKPWAIFLGFGDSSLNYELRVFVSSMDHFLEVKHAMHKAVDRKFRDAGVEIMTLGQYLQPSKKHLPIERYYTLEEFADSATLNRYNRVRAVTLEANLADGLTLGDALAYMENLVKTHLPEDVIIDYKHEGRVLFHTDLVHGYPFWYSISKAPLTA